MSNPTNKPTDLPASAPWYPNSFPGCPAEQKLVMAFRRTLQFVDSIHADVERIMNPSNPNKTETVTGNIVVIEDTRLNLKETYPPANYPLGSLYYITDWQSVVYINTLVKAAPTWQYVAGERFTTLAAFPTGLNGVAAVDDTGLFVNDTTYGHRYRWTGAAYQFAPGDEGSGKYVPTIGPAPTGGVWHLADGTAGVKMSVGDGTTTTVTVKNLNAKRLIGADSAYSEVTGSSPTWAGGAHTDDESAHTHDMNGHGHPFLVVNTVTVQSGAGASVAGAQAGTTGGPSPSSTQGGSAHHHTLGAAAALNPPSDGNGGMPDHTWMVWWVRQ